VWCVCVTFIYKAREKYDPDIWQILFMSKIIASLLEYKETKSGSMVSEVWDYGRFFFLSF